MYLHVDRPVAGLCNAGRFLLWSMRAWRFCRASGHCPPRSLRGAFVTMDAGEALFPFHKAMMLLDQIGQLDVAGMPDKVIGEGEAILLALWQDMFANETDRAGQTLAFFSDDEGRLEALALAMGHATYAFQEAGHHFAVASAASPANGGSA